MKFLSVTILATALVGIVLAVVANADDDETTTASDGEPTWTPNPLCPYPSENLTFYPDPYDCTKYYECYEGNRYTMDCPEGQRWNQDLETCDYAGNVSCDEASTTEDPDEPTESTEVPTTTEASTEGPTTTEGSTEVPTDETTDPDATTAPSSDVCEDEADGALVADPSDCKKFFECIEGEATSFTCPDGLYWNDNGKTCDFLDHSTCNQ